MKPVLRIVRTDGSARNVLLLPAALHGIARDVRARVRRVVARVLRGGDWQSAIGTDYVDVSSRAGLIVIDGPSPLVGGEEHFHVYAIARAFFESGRDIALERRTALVGELLSTPWGVLSVQGQESQSAMIVGAMLATDEALKRESLRRIATARIWPLLEAQGARYSAGLPQGSMLAAVSRALQFWPPNVGLDRLVVLKAMRTGRVNSLTLE